MFPDDFEAAMDLSAALWREGQLDAAIDACRHALAFQPLHPEAHNHLGILLMNRGNISEAINTYLQAVRLRPAYPEAWNNIGLAHVARRELDTAIRAFRRAIEIYPEYAGAFNNLGSALKDTGQIEDALRSYDRAVALKPTDAAFDSNRVYALHYHPAFNAADILREHLKWNEQHAPNRMVVWPAHAAPIATVETPLPRLRIGYVSPDFREHPVGKFLLPMLLHHDRSAFEIFCYSDVRHPDDLTARCVAASDHWRPIAGLFDEQVDTIIRADRIDILVDLSMHMAANRLLLFARKPAPVQVSFLAYPSTTGLRAIDYRLTDQWLDPIGVTDAHYSERSIRLPDYFGCYDPTAMGVADGLDVTPPPALPNGYITYGCLNNFCKVNPTVMALWGRVLLAVPRSRLLLHAPPGDSRQRVTTALSIQGIDTVRIEFVPLQSPRAYMQTYHRIDIGLDTFPYNGHTTSMDAMWMGVPVVTLVGRTAVGRAGLSQLMNLGRPEWIARDADGYVAVAARLAADMDRLAGIRATLRDRMLRSPLTDIRRYIKNIESAYRDMWRGQSRPEVVCAEASPNSLS